MYEQIERNVWLSRLLLALFVALILALGYVFGRVWRLGVPGMGVTALFATGAALWSYYFSDRIVLAISRAREVDPVEFPFLHNAVEGLAIAAGIPKPRLDLIEDSAPNAFATGRDPQHAVVVVTTGLVQKLNRLELEGVLAHEMAHIQHYDIRLSTLVVVLVGIIALISDIFLRSAEHLGSIGSDSDSDSPLGAILVVLSFLLAIFAPIIAQLIRFAVSRQREYLADAGGAMLTRYPEGLASALEKLDADTEPLEAANKATAHLYVVNPLKEYGGKLNGLFSTHPPISERVRRLRGLIAGSVA